MNDIRTKIWSKLKCKSPKDWLVELDRLEKEVVPKDEKFEIVIPEDPNRELTQDDLNLINHDERRDKIRLFYVNNPNVISCYLTEREH